MQLLSDHNKQLKPYQYHEKDYHFANSCGINRRAVTNREYAAATDIWLNTSAPDAPAVVNNSQRQLFITLSEHLVCLSQKNIRDKLLDIVWGYNNDTDERVLDTHMRNLRKALGANGKLIKTVIRRGYRLEDC